MREIIGMKTMAELCFLAAVLSVFPFFHGDNVFLLLLILCGGVSMSVSAVLKDRRFLRFLPLPLMAVPLLASHDVVHCVLVALVALYVLARMMGNGYQVVYWQYVSQSKAMMALMLVVLLAAFVQNRNIPVTIAYLFLFLALTSFVLRQSRLGRYADRKSGILNALYLVACCVLAVLLSAVLTGISTLDWEAAAEVIFMPFAMALYGLATLYSFLGKGIRKGNEAEDATGKLLEENDKELQKYFQEATANAGDGSNWTMPHIGKILAVIAILLLVALVIYGFYRFVKHLLEQNIGYKQEAIFETEKVNSYGNRKKNSTGNRRKIRKFYRGYITLLRSKGAHINRYMTTWEVQNANPDDSKAEAEEKLREIYLKARYDEQTQPTSSDVQEIKELFDQIKKREKDDRNPG